MMNTQVFRPVTWVPQRLGTPSLGFATGIILVVLCAGLTTVCASLEFDPQVPPPVQSTPKLDKAKAKSVVPFEMLPTNHMLVERESTVRGRIT